MDDLEQLHKDGKVTDVSVSSFLSFPTGSLVANVSLEHPVDPTSVCSVGTEQKYTCL